nr:Sir2 family NAD-dependent protein deacetylase [Streptomyces sp. Ag82_O1-12]
MGHGEHGRDGGAPDPRRSQGDSRAAAGPGVLGLTAHRAVAEPERSGVPVRVITQNVDGLHQLAGMPARRVFAPVPPPVCFGQTPSFPVRRSVIGNLGAAGGV